MTDEQEQVKKKRWPIILVTVFLACAICVVVIGIWGDQIDQVLGTTEQELEQIEHGLEDFSDDLQDKSSD